MRSIIAVSLLAAALLVPRTAARASLSIGRGEVVVAPLHGQVSKAQFLFLRRVLKESERAGASALVLDIDTYGGDLHAAVDMVDALGRTSLQTVAWINRNAGSAGALIALGTRTIVMSPVSAIGAAAPVMGSGENLPEAMNDKIVSYFSKYFRSAAERNGHNPDLAEAFINKKKEVKIGDRTVSEKDSLLTLSAQEAVVEHEGRPLLAIGLASTPEEVARLMRLEGAVRQLEPTGFEHLAFWITTLAPVFLIGGLAGAYLEFKTPGFGLPGILSLVCFAIFFTGHYLAGLAGFEAAAVFVLGLALVLVELLFLPGFVVFGLAGALLILGSLLWAMVDRYPNGPALPAFSEWVRPLSNLTLAAAGSAVVFGLLARFLPSLPIFRRLILGAAVASGPSVAPEVAHSGNTVRVGDRGVAETLLRPAGRARFAGRPVDVVADGEYIPAGAAIEVVRVEGFRVVVRAAVD